MYMTFLLDALQEITTTVHKVSTAIGRRLGISPTTLGHCGLKTSHGSGFFGACRFPRDVFLRLQTNPNPAGQQYTSSRVV